MIIFIAAVASVAAIVLGYLYLRERQKLIRNTRLNDVVKRDIEKLQKQFERAKETEEALINAVDDGLILLDASQRILMANTKAKEFADGPMIGETLIAAVRHVEVDEMMQDMVSNSDMYVEQLIEFNEQTKLNVRIQRFNINAEQKNYIMILRDVTALKRAERARRDMVYFLTHDLKTPITVAQLVAETIDDEMFHKEMSKKHKKLYRDKLHDLRQQLGQMSQLVQEMQDLYRIESGQLPILAKPTPILQPVRDGIDHLISLANDKEQTVTIDIDENIIVLIDAPKIQRVINNIVHNAIKYTPHGGSISISAQENDSTVTVSISDTGVGIPKDEVPRIFERFFQVDRARNDGSAGLGLAIAKHIIQKHGGEIWAESEEHRGTTFYFNIYKDIIN